MFLILALMSIKILDKGKNHKTMTPMYLFKDLTKNIIWVLNFTLKVLFKKYNDKNSCFGCEKNFKKITLRT